MYLNRKIVLINTFIEKKMPITVKYIVKFQIDDSQVKHCVVIGSHETKVIPMSSFV